MAYLWIAHFSCNGARGADAAPVRVERRDVGSNERVPIVIATVAVKFVFAHDSRSRPDRVFVLSR
jgi:hypothetical protein